MSIQPKPKNQAPARMHLPIGMVLLGGLVVVNAAGFLIYAAMKKDAPEEQTPQEAAATAEAAQPKQDNDTVGRALRIAGLAALESGDYTEAVAKFTEAARLSNSSGDLPSLLRIARELQDRTESRKTAAAATAAAGTPGAETPAAEAAEPEDDKDKDKAEAHASSSRSSSSSSRRTVRRSTPSRPEPKRTSAVEPEPSPTPSAPAEPEPGILLVTSTPAGLIVELDGKRLDGTPLRVPVPAGSHTVALFQGSEKLFEERVNVNEGSVATVNADVSAKLAPPPPPKTETVAASRSMDTNPGAGRPTTPAPTPTPPPAAPKPAEKPAEAPSAVGELHIISPNAYGEVWINGKSVGFPPIVAKNLPVGTVTVEIRVDGAVRRSMTAKVDEGKRNTVRFR